MRFFHAGAGKVLVGLLTFTLVCLTWVLFRAETVDNAMNMFGAMLVPVAGLVVTDLSQVLTVLGVIAALLGTHWFMRNREFGSMLKRLPWPAIGMILAAMLIAILLSPGEERDFIYFEF